MGFGRERPPEARIDLFIARRRMGVRVRVYAGLDNQANGL
jgi:hypothetical protein